MGSSTAGFAWELWVGYRKDDCVIAPFDTSPRKMEKGTPESQKDFYRHLSIDSTPTGAELYHYANLCSFSSDGPRQMWPLDCKGQRGESRARRL
ncbi:hypothetical protein FIBSPDRAFT_849613, partial [Athelia psychrophila]